MLWLTLDKQSKYGLCLCSVFNCTKWQRKNENQQIKPLSLAILKRMWTFCNHHFCLFFIGFSINSYGPLTCIIIQPPPMLSSSKHCMYACTNDSYNSGHITLVSTHTGNNLCYKYKEIDRQQNSQAFWMHEFHSINTSHNPSIFYQCLHFTFKTWE